MTFEGFTKDGLEFLEALPTRDPAWFKANKKDYQRLVADPAKAFVQNLGARLQELRPDIAAEPKTNGSIGPINNDLRFAPDRPPYKDHLLFKFWEGSPKKTAPTLYVRMAPTNIGFAVGVMPADVQAWRALVDGASGEALARAVAKLERAKKADVVGSELKRVPKPFAEDHPRGELLRHKWLQVRWPEPVPKAVGSAAFTGWCMKRLEACLPIHSILVDGLD